MADLTKAERAAFNFQSHLRSTYWRGFEAGKLGFKLSTCPYSTDRGGYRLAWLRGCDEGNLERRRAAVPPEEGRGDG